MVNCSNHPIILGKSAGMSINAHDRGIRLIWTILAVLAGAGIEWLKAEHLFEKICNKNLNRIKSFFHTFLDKKRLPNPEDTPDKNILGHL